MIRVSEPTPPRNGALTGKPGDIDSWDELPKYLATVLKIEKGTVISLASCGHGNDHTDNRSSAIEIVSKGIRLKDPDSPAGPTESITEVKQVMAGLNIGASPPGIDEELFVSFFSEYLAKDQDVNIDIWHCFVGSTTEKKDSAVKRLAKALQSAKIEKAFVKG